MKSQEEYPRMLLHVLICDIFHDPDVLSDLSSMMKMNSEHVVNCIKFEDIHFHLDSLISTKDTTRINLSYSEESLSSSGDSIYLPSEGIVIYKRREVELYTVEKKEFSKVVGQISDKYNNISLNPDESTDFSVAFYPPVCTEHSIYQYVNVSTKGFQHYMKIFISLDLKTKELKTYETRTR